MILHYSPFFPHKPKIFQYFTEVLIWDWAVENLGLSHHMSGIRGTRHMDKGYSSLGHVRPVLASKVFMVIKSSKFSLKSAVNMILFDGT